MLTLRYLLAVVAAVAATAAAAVAVSNAFRSSQAPLASAAMSIIAGGTAHLDTPVAVRQYLAYYHYAGGRWILANSTGLPVYVLGLGQCPPSIASLLGKTYAARNATVVLTDCVLIMPWVEGNAITHYAATCRSGTDFRPEAAEVEASGVEVRLVLVNC
ncbi:MAG: hypothetical protein AT707_05820 [Pyrobaculum sp. JCHS_4]|jgi:hypothetical protein|nr:MAG: hypothetical protein AT707_05820 [Pyrobaculum sp. JCHS_4]